MKFNPNTKENHLNLGNQMNNHMYPFIAENSETFSPFKSDFSPDVKHKPK